MKASSGRPSQDLRRGSVGLPRPEDTLSNWAKWRTHYIINHCPVCWIGENQVDDRFCDKGKALHDGALLDLKGLIGNKKSAGARWQGLTLKRGTL